MPESDAEPGGFLSRWSRRKALVRQGEPLPAEPPAPAPPPVAAAMPLPAAALPASPAEPAPPATAEVPPAPPAPTLDDVAALAPGADVQRFVAPGVDSTVKNAALKKLFADPHFNVMDGLDTYIDDYGIPDPLPAGMLRQMAQSSFLGLFSDEDKPATPAAEMAAQSPDPTPPVADAAAASPDAPPLPLPDENADLRLQPDDDAGCAAPATGVEPHAGRQP